MVIGHCAIPGLLRNAIFSFHMPLFFIFSGYFFKEQETVSLFKKGYSQLVKPYILTGVVCVCLCLIAQEYNKGLQKIVGLLLGSGSGHILGYEVPIIGPIWFLLALFWCKIFYNIIYKKTHRPLLCCFLISTLAFVFGKYVMCLPLGLLYGLCSLIFYSMGHYMRLYGHNSLINKYLWVGLAIWLLCIWKGHLEIASYDCSLYPVSMLGAFVGTYVVYKCSSKIPRFMMPIAQWLGRNTLLILCYHTIYFFVFLLLKKYFFIPKNIEMDGLLIMIICCVLSFGLPYIHVQVKNLLHKYKSQGQILIQS